MNTHATPAPSVKGTGCPLSRQKMHSMVPAEGKTAPFCFQQEKVQTGIGRKHAFQTSSLGAGVPSS